jgi:hypothetical protein
MTGTPVILPNPAPFGQTQSLLRQDIAVHTWIDARGVRWPIRGGVAPIPPTPGISLESIKGFAAPMTHVDQQGAHQDGVDWLDVHYDKCEIDMVINVWGRTITERRRVFRHWVDGWRAKRLGRYVVYTQDIGEWWMDLRVLGELRDNLPADHLKSWKVNWAARSDAAFWQSFPSTAKWTATGSTSGNKFLALRNRGTIEGWPDYLLQGPGTFNLGDNGPNTRTISIVVKAGELVKLVSLPRKRSATELNSDADVYPRLVNRFATPVQPGTPDNPAGVVHVPFTVTGATADVTSITARLVPQREWPE